jgi:hypothetical protein
MNSFFDRLEICYYNLLLTKDNVIREKVLNIILIMISYYPIFIIDVVYNLNKKMFIDMINNCNKPYLLFLTYDLEAISELLSFKIAYYNKQFYITTDDDETENKNDEDNEDGETENLEWGNS